MSYQAPAWHDFITRSGDATRSRSSVQPARANPVLATHVVPASHAFSRETLLQAALRAAEPPLSPTAEVFRPGSASNFRSRDAGVQSTAAQSMVVQSTCVKCSQEQEAIAWVLAEITPLTETVNWQTCSLDSDTKNVEAVFIRQGMSWAARLGFLELTALCENLDTYVLFALGRDLVQILRPLGPGITRQYAVLRCIGRTLRMRTAQPV